MKKTLKFNYIKIDTFSKIPKYKQLVSAVMEAVKLNSLKKGDRIPSVNELCVNYEISRFSVIKAYTLLREKGIIDVYNGKGYCVTNTHISKRLKIFLIFNKLGVNEKLIYDAIFEGLGEKAEVDINSYNNDYEMLKKFLKQKKKTYTHYIIFPHFMEKIAQYKQLIAQIPREKLIFIGENIEGIARDYAAVYENFEKNIFTALHSVNQKLKKYKKLTLIFSDEQPVGMKEGFVNFCKEQQFYYDIISNFKEHKIQSGEVFVIPDDLYLLSVIEQSKKQKLVVGKDFGIISYNDSPLKRFIADGLTTISTDFEQMGRSAARLVLNSSKEQIEIPCELVQRGSL